VAVPSIISFYLANYFNKNTNRVKKLIVQPLHRSKDSDCHILDIASWAKYDLKPIVHFSTEHDKGNIFLNFNVKEQSIRAKATENNGKVWEDSCVEFFVMPENDGIYYNFEFNCIGTKLLAVGNSRNNRTFATAEILDKIIVQSSLNSAPFDEIIGEINWEINIKIPINCFFNHPIKSLKNKTFRANFYKCGDELSTPHFLSWTKIETPEPDFHTPQYFGEIYFI
jgi:Carbohydrate-binding family 9